MRYLVNITYNGLRYYGFQIQDDKPTIEGEIERVLSKIFNNDTKVVGCSRTDKGVHANDFYFHFDIDKELDINKVRYSLNSLLSKDIYVKDIRKVDNEFNARYNVISKEYVYVINMGEYNPILDDYIYNYNKNIDTNLVKKASNYLIGEHDYKSFTSDNEKDNTVRTINYINFEVKDNLLYIYISGNGFLKYMVRNIVGLFIDINEGNISINDIENIINSKDRTKLGIKVPSCGLYLNKVVY